MAFRTYATTINRSQYISGFRRFSIAALLLMILTSVSALAQQTNNWLFGHNAWIQFPTSGNPISHTGSLLFTSEGTSSISDSSGNLLFYTDGMTVWNGNHTVMTNGTGLNGNESSTDSALIVPCTCGKYFVFTTDAAEHQYAKGLQYSVVDPGIGSVGPMNVVLLQPASEKITAIRDNSGGFWVITHGMGSNRFYSWHVTPGGKCTLSPQQAVISAVGTAYSGGTGATVNYGQGQIKASPDRTKLAVAGMEINGTSFLELFSFNASTGVVGNIANLRDSTPTDVFYGVEFSPNNQYLYVTATRGPNNLYRYSATATTAAAFVSSKTLLHAFQVPKAYDVGALQLGPDHKIYMARVLKPYVSAVNDPDNANPSLVGYVDQAVQLIGGTQGFLGLPAMFAGMPCDPLPPVDPCCPPWNSAMLKKMMFYQGTGGIGDSYTLKFQPSAALNMSMLAYLNYLHTMNFGITSITITFKLIDLSNNNQILETQSATWTWPNGTPTLGFFYHLMNTNNWYRVDTIISLNGTNQFFSEKCIHNWIDVNVQVQGRVKILHMRSADGGISETRINSENQIQ